MGFKRAKFTSEEEKREITAKRRLKQFVKNKVKGKSAVKEEDAESDYWKGQFLKAEMPEIDDESGTEYWTNLLSIYRSDRKKSKAEEKKKENTEHLRVPKKTPKGKKKKELREVKQQKKEMKKVKDDLEDISEVQGESEQSRRTDEDNIFEIDYGYKKPTQPQSSLKKKSTNDLLKTPPTVSVTKPQSNDYFQDDESN